MWDTSRPAALRASAATRCYEEPGKEDAEMRKLAVVTGVAVLLLSVAALAAPATLAADMFLKIEGVDGGAQNKDHRGWIKVITFEWDLTAAQEAASGQSTGRREHQPLVAVIAVDESTPKLAKILQGADKIDTVLVDVYRPDGSYMGFALHEVRILGVAQRESDDKNGGRSLQEVSFGYERIEWSKR